MFGCPVEQNGYAAWVIQNARKITEDTRRLNATNSRIIHSYFPWTVSFLL